MKKSKFQGKSGFFLLGIISTVWFLVRVIPKPSRAAYPCMRAAAPFMSGFVLYLISLGGITLAFRRAKIRVQNRQFMYAGYFALVGMLGLAFLLSQDSARSYADTVEAFGPADGPNQPMGNALGINPGRVVWVWDPNATNGNCINAFDIYKPENTNQKVVSKMVSDGIRKLAGKNSLSESWNALFHYFNKKKSLNDEGYAKGQKIFIKINQGTANGKLSEKDRKSGFYIPKRLTESADAQKGLSGTCETYPNVVLEILRQLVNEAGVDQKDIAIGDPISHIFGHNYEIWAREFPNVVYVDKSSADFGRTLIRPTENDLVYYSDKRQSDKLYDVIEQADYLINVANLKPHGRAGVSLTAKNHFGSHTRNSAFHLHYSLISPVSLGNPTNNGYHKYRVMVDLMGSKYLGQNTLLYVVDGLYGGGSNETRVPVKYFMPPFNNDWCNSIFMSQDQVALESVCYDFIRSEWNGVHRHSPANNDYESIPNVPGVDDYLHQAADRANWPEGIVYDPDNSGKPIGSLGVHEHWNNPVSKQYSLNLGKKQGIELVAIPDSLVGAKADGKLSADGKLIVKEAENKESEKNEFPSPEKKTNKSTNVKISVTTRSFGDNFSAKKFFSAVVDEDNKKWFLTEKGMVSFNGHFWTAHDDNKHLPANEAKELGFNFSGSGQNLWIASEKGVAVVALPLDATSEVKNYAVPSLFIPGDHVASLAVGKGKVRWVGTDKGIAALAGNKWMKGAYEEKYPEFMFGDYPIKAMATSIDGDSLYVATEGAGVTRVYRNEVDAISGASEYVQWDSIKIPSDKVYSICIAPDGTQWFGTDKGVGKHSGYRTLAGWKVYSEKDGLINNFVQAIAVDRKGRIWFGTPKGISVFDGSSWRSYTVSDGLPGDNILCLAVDKDNMVWVGTDSGVAFFSDDKLVCFK